MPLSLALTPANILGYSHKYSFRPGNAAVGYMPANETKLTGEFTDFRHTLVGTGKKTGRGKLVVQKDPNMLAHQAMLPFLVSVALNDTAGTQSYFLPWDSRGAAVEMTIPPFNAGDDLAKNPPLFFTAALSGCSIIFKGTAKKPTIYHCGTGGEGGNGAETTGNSNKFFRKMLRDIKAKNLGRSNYNVSTQVKSTDYLIKAGGRTGAAAQHAADFQTMMKDHYASKLIITDVTMRGCVFGVRTGDQWAFYLQENASTSYYRISDVLDHSIPRAIARGAKKFDITDVTQADFDSMPATKRQLRERPAVVTQVFPGGAGHANMVRSWKTFGE